MPPLQLPPNIGNLWKTMQWPLNKSTVVHIGSIINFHYIGQRRGQTIHDPYPLVLVSNIYSDAVRGVNLNYLTVPYVKSLIDNFLEKRFSYDLIRNDSYIVGAFRSYKRNGISQLRMMDSDFLRGVAALSRTLDPNELDQIRMQIEELMKDQVNQPVAQAGTVQQPV